MTALGPGRELSHLTRTNTGDEQLVDLALADGRVTRRHPSSGPGTRPPPGHVLDAGGRLVVPAFVDAHVHLDTAYLLGSDDDQNDDHDDDGSPGAGSLAVRARANRAVDALVRNGTTAARVQVEVDPGTGLVLAHLHQLLAQQNAGRCQLQLVAFPRHGLTAPGSVQLLAEALQAGLHVVGGQPGVDADPVRHLDVVFGLAERFGVPVDLHLDIGEPTGPSLLGLVAERTRALGLAGRVVVGHVTTLAAMAPLDRARALSVLAEAGIALVSLPLMDLHLERTAPVLEAAAAGVRVAVANSTIAGPSAPFGNASLVQAAWLSGVLGRAASDDDQSRLLDMITRTPAEVLGLPARGPEPGAVADLVVLDVDDPALVLRAAPGVSATVAGGRLVHVAEPPLCAG